MEGDSAARDAVVRILAAAAEVQRQHVPDAAGWCSGCLAGWGRLMFIEACTQVQWAAAVRARYGRAERD